MEDVFKKHLQGCAYEIIGALPAGVDKFYIVILSILPSKILPVLLLQPNANASFVNRTSSLKYPLGVQSICCTTDFLVDEFELV